MIATFFIKNISKKLNNWKALLVYLVLNYNRVSFVMI
jgi:hypothetical protein